MDGCLGVSLAGLGDSKHPIGSYLQSTQVLCRNIVVTYIPRTFNSIFQTPGKECGIPMNICWTYGPSWLGCVQEIHARSNKPGLEHRISKYNKAHLVNVIAACILKGNRAALKHIVAAGAMGQYHTIAQLPATSVTTQ